MHWTFSLYWPAASTQWSGWNKCSTQSENKMWDVKRSQSFECQFEKKDSFYLQECRNVWIFLALQDSSLLFRQFEMLLANDEWTWNKKRQWAFRILRSVWREGKTMKQVRSNNQTTGKRIDPQQSRSTRMNISFHIVYCDCPSSVSSIMIWAMFASIWGKTKFSFEHKFVSNRSNRKLKAREYL